MDSGCQPVLRPQFSQASEPLGPDVLVTSADGLIAVVRSGRGTDKLVAPTGPHVEGILITPLCEGLADGVLFEVLGFSTVVVGGGFFVAELESLPARLLIWSGGGAADEIEARARMRIAWNALVSIADQHNQCQVGRSVTTDQAFYLYIE